MSRVVPPTDEAELVSRANALSGRFLSDIAREVGLGIPDLGRRSKGKAGDLIERALGATSGSAKAPDFAHLGIELKTIPVNEALTPRESTFVCTIRLAYADQEEWKTSWVRRKLSCVLWVPIVVPSQGPRRVGSPFLWRPTRAQEAVFAADFDDIMGMLGTGGIEGLDARAGRYLQARPKAAHSRVRTLAFDPEGVPIAAPPKGFYLRTRFTGAMLRDPAAVPD